MTDHTARGRPTVPGHNVLPGEDEDGEMPDPVPAEINPSRWYVVERTAPTAALVIHHEANEQADALALAGDHPDQDVVVGSQLQRLSDPIRWAVGDGPEVVL